MSTKITKINTDELLDKLHSYLIKTGCPLKEKEMKIADEKMTKILEDGLIEELIEKTKTKELGEDFNNLEDKEVYSEVEFIVLKFYYAIYNDNVELYRKIVDKNISLGNSVFDHRLYLLNKEIRDIFKTDNEYFSFISIYQPAIKRFYSSIGNQDTPERDGFIDSFCKIIKSDKRYLSRKKNENPSIFMNLLTSRNLRVFGEEFLKNATNRQKEVINTFIYSISDEDLKIVEELITKYPSYVVPCRLTSEFLNTFTIDEIGEMSFEQTILYSKAVEENVVDKLKEIFKIKPDFNCPKNMINKDIFDELSVDTIVMLSDKAKEQLARVKHDDNFKKNVNRIVRRDLYNLKDLIKKMIESKNNKPSKRK